MSISARVLRTGGGGASGSFKSGNSELLSSSIKEDVRRDCIINLVWWITRGKWWPSRLGMVPTFGKSGCIENLCATTIFITIECFSLRLDLNQVEGISTQLVFST
jgi:hypothetical protein